jgi:actin-related protein
MSTEADASTESAPPQPPPKKKPEPKKRRRSADSPQAKSKKSKGAASAAAASTAAAVRNPSAAPTHTLIIDNGGDTLKYGWITDEQPKYLPNVTARLAHQITLLVGDELARVQNPNSLVTVTRSLERGLISNMGNQTQVWKRLLDLLGVAIPLQSEAATALGWKVSAGRTKQTDLPAKNIPSHSIAVVLLLPPHCPRLLLDQIVYVWMEDFGVAHVGFGNSTVCAAQEHSSYKTSCTVDLGWSSSLIVPTFRNRAILPQAIQRMPIGGRHLINILKYYMSYRQYNLMDQEHLLKPVLEQLSFVSLQFEHDLKIARYKPSGRRPYDRDYVLPDYQRTQQGHIRIPPALQRDLEREAKENNQMEEEDDEDDDDDEDEDEDFEAGDSGDDEDDNLSYDEGNNKVEADKKKSKENGKKMAEDDDEDDDDDEEQTIEQRRKQLLQQRAEEERRRREQEEEEQVLRLSVERFAIPEVLFRPSDAGFPSELVGLAPAIIQSIQACPAHFHAALYQSIRLVGGLSKIPDLAPRLEREVRALAPTEYEVKIDVAESPVDRAWLGAKRWIAKAPYTEWSINREEWENAGRRKAYGRLLMVNGGACV